MFWSKTDADVVAIICPDTSASIITVDGVGEIVAGPVPAGLKDGFGDPPLKLFDLKDFGTVSLSLPSESASNPVVCKSVKGFWCMNIPVGHSS